MKKISESNANKIAWPLKNDATGGNKPLDLNEGNIRNSIKLLFLTQRPYTKFMGSDILK